VYLSPPRLRDAEAFLAAARASRRLHGRWVRAPHGLAGFRDYVARFGARAQRDPQATTHAGVLVRRSGDDALVGVFNFSEIVRGSFHSAYLGYYAFAPHAGSGLMADGLALALEFAFRTLKLHRVEVNVQPRNLRSHVLVLRAGFVREGYSRLYLRIAGRWRDHVRYAMLAEDWRARRKQRR
jgi:ribosomal-protein-alanine N-acetyltransferase